MIHDLYYRKYNKSRNYSVVDMNKVYYVDRIDDMIKEGIQHAVNEITNDNIHADLDKIRSFLSQKSVRVSRVSNQPARFFATV